MDVIDDSDMKGEILLDEEEEEENESEIIEWLKIWERKEKLG